MPALPAISLGYAVANPNGVYPPPLSIANLPSSYQTGDVLRLYIDTGYTTTGANSVTHTLTDADTAPGAQISFGTAISSIMSGVHAFAIRGERGAGYSLTSATVVHGDTVAPTISGSSPASIAEQQVMLVTVTASEPSYFAIGGADAGLVEKVGSEPATTIGIRLIGNALLDYETKASYALTVTPTDRASNVGASTAVTLSVIDKDDVPDELVFAATSGVALGATAQSGVKTISGLDAGIFAAISVTGGSYIKNGGAPITAAAQVVNGDKIQLVGTAPSATGKSQVVVTYGGLMATWEIRTVGYAPAVATTWATGVGSMLLSNAGKTAKGDAAGTPSVTRTTKTFGAGTKGTFYLEMNVDAVDGNSGGVANLALINTNASYADGQFPQGYQGGGLYLGADGTTYFAVGNGSGSYFTGVSSFVGGRLGALIYFPGDGTATISYSFNGVSGVTGSLPYADTYAITAYLSSGSQFTIVPPNFMPAGAQPWDATS